ncbi:hypothetical protein KM043_017875 [Ampulex compressa]|nr:hypothetical protein KM043_017875 [Ampulex compressa]
MERKKSEENNKIEFRAQHRRSILARKNKHRRDHPDIIKRPPLLSSARQSIETFLRIPTGETRSPEQERQVVLRAFRLQARMQISGPSCLPCVVDQPGSVVSSKRPMGDTNRGGGRG